MNTLLVALALPGFLLLMWLEYCIAKRKNKTYFHFNSSIANISIGIAERLSEVFLAGVFYTVFDYIHRNYGLFDISASVFTYLILLIVTDFLWYWYHRFGHEINLFWAAHIVHHQSEDFNFTVSARITMFQSFLRLFFWSLLPLIGFSAPMVTLVLLAHGLYPFFVHTRLVGKLGWLEYIFVTPSHHRVHHASNEQYLDKNYGSIFIIWDKLFGTFTKEEEEPVYGLTAPLRSHSFLWQHFHYYLELWEAARAEGQWKDKLMVFLRRPDSVPEIFRERLEQKFSIQKKNVQQSMAAKPKLRTYVMLQIALALGLLFILSLIHDRLAIGTQLCLVLFILLTLINSCAIIEQRVWIIYLEYARLMVCFFVMGQYYQHTWFYLLELGAFVWLLYYFRFFRKTLILYIFRPGLST